MLEHQSTTEAVSLARLQVMHQVQHTRNARPDLAPTDDLDRYRYPAGGDDQDSDSFEDDLEAEEDLVESDDEDQPVHSAAALCLVPPPAPWKRLSQSAEELHNFTVIRQNIAVSKIQASVKSEMWWGARKLESSPGTGEPNPQDIFGFCIKLSQYYMAAQV